MRVVVTGSAGHLGEALVRTLREGGHEVTGLDRLASGFTDRVGSICDPALLRDCMQGADFVMHAAALHKPHVATHARSAFVETNVRGTLEVLEAALACGVSGVVMTSTTSAFGSALRPAPSDPAAWVTEEVRAVPRNIYGVTKTAAEDLCELFHRSRGLPSIVLRTSRFFPEADDDAELRRRYDDANLKANEYLHRRLDVADAVQAHVCAAERMTEIGFGRYVVSATTPFSREHLARLRRDAPGVVRELHPEYEPLYARLGWRMSPELDRVYVNRRAREELGWRPRYDFGHVLARLEAGGDWASPLARAVGSKGYHPESFADGGPYPVEESVG